MITQEELKILLYRLKEEHSLSRAEWAALISGRTPELSELLFAMARSAREPYYGHDIYVRGLIEYTNTCKNDCFYCGIRKSNDKVHRYHLSDEEILSCCEEGYAYGLRTFVLQGGEDGKDNDERLCRLISAIKTSYPDCAITLSIGERSFSSYQALFDAGADRYLLRHETFDAAHYKRLHPQKQTASNRQQCLWNLKKIGYQVGTGFMVGSPYQTPDYLAEDMLFLEKLNPQMVGIGPFIPHRDTPFARESAGTLELTLFMLGLIRLLLPKVLLPATTALETIHPQGWELGISAGANVIMPNLSPLKARKDYELYDKKNHDEEDFAQCKSLLDKRMETIGYHVVTARGDSLNV